MIQLDDGTVFCSVCHLNCRMDDEGNIPWHRHPDVGWAEDQDVVCRGSGLPPLVAHMHMLNEERFDSNHLGREYRIRRDHQHRSLLKPVHYERLGDTWERVKKEWTDKQTRAIYGMEIDGETS